MRPKLRPQGRRRATPNRVVIVQPCQAGALAAMHSSHASSAGARDADTPCILRLKPRMAHPRGGARMSSVVVSPERRVRRQWARFRLWLRRGQQRGWAEARRTELEAALVVLEIPVEDAAKVRGVLRSWRPAVELPVVGVGLFVGMALLWRIIVNVAESVVRSSGWSWGERAVGYYRWIQATGDSSTGQIRLRDFLVVCAVMIVWALPPFVWCIRRTTTARNCLVLKSVEAVLACAKARAAAGRHRAAAFRRVDRSCRAVEQDLFKVHRISRSVPRRSPRTRPIKRHAAMVAGAQGDALQRVDVDPRQALSELARLQITVAENYLHGRHAALLPPDQLEGVRPVSRLRSNWLESAHIAAAIIAAMVAAAGAAKGLPALGVSKDLSPWLTLGTAVLAATLVAGWGRVSRMLELLPG